MTIAGSVHNWAPAVYLPVKDMRDLFRRALCVGRPLSAMVIALEIRRRETLERRKPASEPAAESAAEGDK